MSRNQRTLLHHGLYGIIVEVLNGRVNELEYFFLSRIQSLLKIDTSDRQIKKTKQNKTSNLPKNFIMDQTWNRRQDFEV